MVKYGFGEGSWTLHPICITHGVGVWKAIEAGWGSFSQYVTLSVGEGSRVRYWDDEWCVYTAIAFLSTDFLFT
jgi:hypothetical protein